MDALGSVGEKVIKGVGPDDVVGAVVVGADEGASVGDVVGAQNEHALHLGLKHLKRLSSVAQSSPHWSSVGNEEGIRVGLTLGKDVPVSVGPAVIVGDDVVGANVGVPVGSVVGPQKGHDRHLSFKHLKRLSSVSQSLSHVSLVGDDEPVGTEVGDSVMIFLS